MTTHRMKITAPMTDPPTADVRFRLDGTVIASVTIVVVLGTFVCCVTSTNIKD